MADRPLSPPAIQRAVLLQLLADRSRPAVSRPQTPPVTRSGGRMHTMGLPLWLGGSALDLGSTLAVRDRPGVREANPVWGSAGPKAMAANAALTGLVAWLLDRAHHRGSKAALPLALAGGVGRGLIGVQNLRQGR